MYTWFDVVNLRVFKSVVIKRNAVFDIEREDGKFTALTGERLLEGARLATQPLHVAKTTSITLTVAELQSGVITGLQGANAIALYTMPTGPEIESALALLNPILLPDHYFDFSIINLSTDADERIRLVDAPGINLVGSMVVAANLGPAQNSSGRFRVRRDAADTYTVYRIS